MHYIKKQIIILIYTQIKSRKRQFEIIHDCNYDIKKN